MAKPDSFLLGGYGKSDDGLCTRSAVRMDGKVPGDVLGSDLHTIYYIRSESAYSLARRRGLWEVVKGCIARRHPYLLSFRQAFGDSRWSDVRYLGMQSIATEDVVGSLGREREFSRGFLPVGSVSRQKERWRQSYTGLLSGNVDSPVQVCRAGGKYFVVNGHHRMSVARYLNLATIRAHVSQIEAKDPSAPERDSA